MKTLPLLFSLPLFVGVLAAHASPAQAPPDINSAENSILPKPEETSEIQKLISQIDDKVVAALSLPGTAAALSGATDCCPARRNPAFYPATYTRPDALPPDGSTIPTASGELTSVRYRGANRLLEVMTDQYHIRHKDGRDTVVKMASKRELGEVESEAATATTLPGDRAEIVAYLPGKPKTNQNKLLLTKRVIVRLASGVTPSVFAKSTGSIAAQRPSFAPEALILTYATTSEAVLAAQQLRKMAGVVDAELVVASYRSPEFVPSEQYFSGGGPAYQPTPLSDNITGAVCGGNLCPIIPTSAYQWWANNRAAGFGPVNSVAISRFDLGDYPPIQYAAGFPKVQGEQADLRLPLAWENLGDFDAAVSGRGKKILIVDDGIQAHQDLDLAIDLNSARHFNFFSDTATAAPVDRATDSHGTSLAGIAGARIKLGKGIAGVAPGCIFHSAVAIKRFLDEVEWAQAFALGSTLKDSDNDGLFIDEDRGGQVFFDICLNASGESSSGDALDLTPETWLWKRAIRFGATRGRATSGVIYVTSAGNGGDGHNNTNYSEQKNAIYQIPVGSCSELGRRIARSNPGANIVCVAPSWGDELPPLMDWGASPGRPFGNRPLKVNAPVEPDNVPSPFRRITQGVPTISSTSNTAYDFNFTGTSASAAMVAGVVALMLEMNPSLNARDVKEILLRSCRVNNDIRVTYDHPPKIWPTQWRMSNTGNPMHAVFGAGLIDANQAVLIAKQWPGLPIDPLPPIKLNVEAPDFGKTIAKRNTETGGLYYPIITSLLIPTDGRSIEVILPNPPQGMRLENVEVRLIFYHKRRGDLEIKLVAPGSAGWETGREMESVLYAPHRDDYTESRWDSTQASLRDPTDWTFTTVRHWGTVMPSNSSGNWKVVVRDAISQGKTLTPTDDDPVFVPVDNPTDVQSQRLAGVGITYHGTFSKKLGTDPPLVKATKFRVGPSTEHTKVQLTYEGVGVDKEGAPLFPPTNWDFFNTADIVPMQPTNAAREWEHYEHFPAARTPHPEEDPNPENLIRPQEDLLDWPLQPLPPFWIPFVFGDPPQDGPSGGLGYQPAWVTLSPDDPTFMRIKDTGNNNPATNFLDIRLNRRTGELTVIPLNKGKFHFDVYVESIIGMSKPKTVEITVAVPGYEAWLGAYFDSPEIFDPEIVGFDKDPDHDGIPNGAEFAMRLDPTVIDTEAYTSRIEDTEVVFNYQEDILATSTLSPAPGNFFRPEISEDLTTWSEVIPTVLSENNFLRDMEVRIPLGDERIFFRLNATREALPVGP